MKIVSYGKYKCPYCNTVVELEKRDIQQWNDVIYFDCPNCDKTPHINSYNFSTWLFGGKKAIKVE